MTNGSRFIAMEGLDGSGHTTQARLLAKRLSAMGVDAVFTCEPTEHPLGKLIRQVLRGEAKSGEEVLPYLFAGDRRQHLSEDIEPALANGKWVVTDRYMGSSLAYQAEITSFEHVVAMNAGFRIPDMVMMFTLSPAECMGRIISKGEKIEVFETESRLAKIAGAYEKAMKWFESMGSSVVRIPSGGTIEEVAQDVWECVCDVMLPEGGENVLGLTVKE